MNSDNPPSMVAGLLRDLREEAATLVKQQVALATTEARENLSRLGGHLAHIALGGVVTFAGVIVLLIGVGLLTGLLLERAGLHEATARWLGTASVGLIVALVGWGLLNKARKALAQDPLAPRKTLQSLKDDQHWAQQKLHHPHESTT